mgnify:CR=1 FL=1
MYDVKILYVSKMHYTVRVHFSCSDRLRGHTRPFENIKPIFIFFVFLYFSFITGSYDRTCKVWDTASGEELHTLEGHRNVVYAIAYNNPYG